MTRLVALVLLVLCLFVQPADAFSGRLRARVRTFLFGPPPCVYVPTTTAEPATDSCPITPVPVIRQIEGLIPQPQRARPNPR